MNTRLEASERMASAVAATERAARRFAETRGRCVAAFAAAEAVMDRAQASLATAEERVRRAQIAMDLIRENMQSRAAAREDVPTGRHRTSH